MLFRKFITGCCLSLGVAVLLGQNADKYSHSVMDIAVKKLYQNPDEAITFSQSAVINAKTAKEKIVFQNIMSQAFAMKGDFVQSIKALPEENLYTNDETSRFLNFFLQCNLAEQYQNLGLYRQSENALNRIFKNAELLNPTENTAISAKLYQLQSVNFYVSGKFKDAESALNKSNSLLSESNHENKIIRNENELFTAILLLNQNKIAEAKNKIETVLNDASAKEYYFLQAFGFECLSRIYFLEKNNAKSIECLETALSTIENSDYKLLKLKIYESLSKNYAVLQNTEKYRQYNKIFLETKAGTDADKKNGIRYIVRLVENRELKNIEYIEKKEHRKTLLISFSALTILASLGFYFFSETKTARNLLASYEKLKEKYHKKPMAISKEKEEEILKKLEEFEQSEIFLNKNMSLATLAGQMDTNTKYLSEIINTYKGKNFNSYINELRIRYIENLLKTNPPYLNYKLSYLADISGFSSHSAFATVFKTVAGISPNIFIQQIKNTKHKT